MGSVHIQTLSQGERDWIIIQRRVGSRIMCLDGGMGESRHKFLDVANSVRSG